MKISSKGIQAVKIMIDIMTYGNAGPVAIKDVAQRNDISVKYAEQIVSILNTAGLLKSIRGPKGGYQPTKAAEEATLGTILKLTELSLKENNDPEEVLAFGEALQDLNASIEEALNRYSLRKLQEKQVAVGNDYII